MRAGSRGSVVARHAAGGHGTDAVHELIVGRYGAGGRDVTVAVGMVLGLHVGSTGNFSISGVRSTWTGDLTPG